MQRVIHDHKDVLPEAVVLEVTEKKERIILGKTSSMDTAIQPTGTSRIAAADQAQQSAPASTVSEQEIQPEASKPDANSAPETTQDNAVTATDSAADTPEQAHAASHPAMAETATEAKPAPSPKSSVATPLTVSEIPENNTVPEDPDTEKEPAKEVVADDSELSGVAPAADATSTQEQPLAETAEATDGSASAGTPAAPSTELETPQGEDSEQDMQQAGIPTDAPGSTYEWAFLIGGAILFLFLARAALKSSAKMRKNGQQKKPGTKQGSKQGKELDAPVSSSEVPRLSSGDERKLELNLSQISLVQTSILSSQGDKEIKSIYVTSNFNGEGKTTAAISIAHGLSINKNEVLLIDGNPRSPKIHEAYQSPIEPGLLNKLDQNGDSGDLVRHTYYPHLSIVTFGSHASGRPDLIAEDRLMKLLSAYGEQFDYIVMDGHSLTGSDTSIVASKFDAIILVAQCEKTKWEIIKDASQKLTLMGGNVLGIVLNRRKFYLPKFIYNHL